MSFTCKFFAYFKFYSDWGRVIGKIKQNELDCCDIAPLSIYKTHLILRHFLLGVLGSILRRCLKIASNGNCENTAMRSLSSINIQLVSGSSSWKWNFMVRISFQHVCLLKWAVVQEYISGKENKTTAVSIRCNYLHNHLFSIILICTLVNNNLPKRKIPANLSMVSL